MVGRVLLENRLLRQGDRGFDLMTNYLICKYSPSSDHNWLLLEQDYGYSYSNIRTRRLDCQRVS